MLPIQCIAFDADDTLWHNQIFYTKAENDFFALIPRPRQEVAAHFCDVERRNLSTLGYGAKAMTLSMIETAIDLVPDFPTSRFADIVEIGKSLLRVPTLMLPSVVETMQRLQKKFRIFIVTKGELDEQRRKFDNSPLDKSIDYFVVDKKNIETYRALFRHEHVDIDTLLMVGNSPKSDIQPILELGGWAAYLPFETTWALEQTELAPHPKLLQPKAFSDLINILL